MKTIKVSEATGAALDWLVWVAAGGAAAYPKTATGKAFLKLWKGNTAKYVHPSTDWSQGGPIIERDEISLYRMTSDWIAVHNPVGDGQSAPTPLIAAMRCYVASKLGETVEVPEELL